MTILKELLAVVGFDFNKNEVDEASDSLDGLTDTVRTLGRAFVANEIVQGISSFIGGMVEMGTELDLNARRLGVTTDQMQQFGLMAADTGAETSDFVDAVGTLQQRFRDATLDPGGQQAQALRRLGMEIPRSVEDMPSAIDLLRQASDGIHNMTNQTDRVGIAMQLFTDRGRNLLPILQQGAAGIDQYAVELENLGGGVSTDFIEASRRTAREQARLNVVWTSFQNLIGQHILPIVGDIAEKFVAFSSGLVEMARNTHVVELALASLTGLLTFAAVQMLIAYAVPLLTFAAVAIAIAFVIVLVDDLITLFEGGDSVVGEFIDALFGINTAATWVENLTILWDGLTQAVRRGMAAIRGEEFPEGPTAHEQAQEGQEQRRRAAAADGRVIGTRGQSFEEARADMDRFRAEAGLPELDAQGQEVSGPSRGRRGAAPATSTAPSTALVPQSATGVTAATAAPSSGNRVSNVAQTTNTTIRVEGGADARAIRQMETTIDRVLSRRNREAADALGEEAAD